MISPFELDQSGHLFPTVSSLPRIMQAIALGSDDDE
jgi:hypothetical protein